MKTNTPTPLAIAVVATVAGLGIFALSRRSPAPPRGPVGVLVGLDASDSVRAQHEGQSPLLGASVNLVAQLGETLDPNRDRLTVFRVDSQTQEFYDAKAPRDPEAFHHTVIQRMKPRPRRGGTFPARFWAEVARRAQGASRPVAVLYAGDADNDDFTAAALDAMRRAGLALGKNPRVAAVYICGANPKNWAGLRRVFAPLGDRLHLQAPSEMDVTPLVAGLEDARPQPDSRLARR